ncbi:glutamate receptor 2.7-like [Aristolochia californica]|uniref:glutamate receptor 2.7-like n=1 Tax=Aristolochia californica TaxID=171875 RepID=UPI0035D73C9D
MEAKLKLPFQYSSFFCYLMLFRSLITSDGAFEIVDVDVGVILDFHTSVGIVGRSIMSVALEDFYASIGRGYRTRLKFHYRDCHSVIEAASEALELIKRAGVKAIIGPQTSEEADFLAYMGSKAHVPVVFFSAGSSLLSPSRTPYFIRMGQSDSSQAKPIAAILNAFGWTDVVLVHDDSYSGNALIPYLTDAVQEVGTTIRRRITLPSIADEAIIHQIMNELSADHHLQAKVFIVHLPVSLCGMFFQQANEAGMMVDGYAWLVTTRVSNLVRALDPSAVSSMEGVLGIKTYVPEPPLTDNFRRTWIRKFRKEQPEKDIPDLDVYALWAYDATWAVALAAEKALSAGVPHYPHPSVEGDSTKLMDMEVSPVGPKLLQALLATQLNGLNWDRINLAAGRLNSSNTFEIINLMSGSSGGRKVGYWTPIYGLSRSLSSEKNYSTKVEDLSGIIWPGGLTSGPQSQITTTNKILTSGPQSLITTPNKRLRIGFPIKKGFTEFVRGNEYNITEGYSVDIFRAVMEAMPYKVQLVFQPYNHVHGGDSGYYDNLTYQVHLNKYDAVVGDTTITGQRSRYVDFSQPYTDSGISMIVPVVENVVTKKLWWFLVPLSMGLWLATIGMSVLKGVIVWFFERSTNKEFQGTKAEQIGKILYFSFTIFVFANKEKLKTNQARFISSLWTFIVFVLVTSYGANLTSILTVEKIRPKVTDLQTLIKNREKIGYQTGSFVLKFLKDQGADESNLKPCGTAKEYANALELGSANGGVSAIVDEIPYIKVFLRSYCRSYTMAGKTYRTGGFGFVFPRDSPMVSNVSRSILQLFSDGSITQMEDKWFANKTCLNPLETTDFNYELSLSSFKFIYLTTLSVSAVTVIIHCINLKYEERKRARVTAGDDPDEPKDRGTDKEASNDGQDQTLDEINTHYHEEDAPATEPRALNSRPSSPVLSSAQFIEVEATRN